MHERTGRKGWKGQGKMAGKDRKRRQNMTKKDRKHEKLLTKIVHAVTTINYRKPFMITTREN